MKTKKFINNHKICQNMQKYAVAPEVCLQCIYLHLYAKNMGDMQDM